MESGVELHKSRGLQKSNIDATSSNIANNLTVDWTPLTHARLLSCEQLFSPVNICTYLTFLNDTD